MHDIIIKNGTIIDGTGAKRFIADIAINDGKISSIGEINESAKKDRRLKIYYYIHLMINRSL